MFLLAGFAFHGVFCDFLAIWIIQNVAYNCRWNMIRCILFTQPVLVL